MKRAVLLTVAGACALYLAAPWVAILVMACIAATLEDIWRAPEMDELGRIVGPSPRDQVRERRQEQRQERRHRPF